MHSFLRAMRHRPVASRAERTAADLVKAQAYADARATVRITR